MVDQGEELLETPSVMSPQIIAGYSNDKGSRVVRRKSSSNGLMSWLPFVLDYLPRDLFLTPSDLIEDLLLELQAAQLVSVDKPSIQPDLVGEVKKDMWLRGMAKDNGVREKVSVKYEFVPDPIKHFFLLLV